MSDQILECGGCSLFKNKYYIEVINLLSNFSLFGS